MALLQQEQTSIIGGTSATYVLSTIDGYTFNTENLISYTRNVIEGHTFITNNGN